MKLTVEEAERLINEGPNGQTMPDFKIRHCYVVANAARKIAEKCGLDGEKAYILGLVHDIGCHMQVGKQHPFSGYLYLKQLGYDEEANICLTHSFLNGDPNCTADGPIVENGVVKENSIFPWEDEKASKFVLEFLKNHQYTPYEKIINLCDLMCTDKMIGLESRMSELIERKGVFYTTMNHCQKAKALKDGIEKKMGCTIADLFPEIEENIKSKNTYVTKPNLKK